MYSQAHKYFNDFINNNYDINDPKVIHKLKHTYQVVNNAKYICEKLNLDEENMELAMLIALLHDIGRFTQAKEMKTFREDITNFDHATLGVKLLFEAGEIRKYIKDSKYDNIIKVAIGNHSKYMIDDLDLSSEEMLHLKIIRDADKLDNIRSKTVDDIYTMANIYPSDIEETNISLKVYNDFSNGKTILSTDRKTGIDMWLSYIALIFGLEYKCSYELVKEKDYINLLFKRFNYKLEMDRMNELRNITLHYVDDKINN